VIHHGGVAVLVHKNVCVAEVIIDDAFDSLEILCIDLLLVKGRLQFLVVYRPPQNDAAACSYVDLLVACLEKYSSTEYTNFILGDSILSKWQLTVTRRWSCRDVYT